MRAFEHLKTIDSRSRRCRLQADNTEKGMVDYQNRIWVIFQGSCRRRRLLIPTVNDSQRDPYQGHSNWCFSDLQNFVALLCGVYLKSRWCEHISLRIAHRLSMFLAACLYLWPDQCPCRWSSLQGDCLSLEAGILRTANGNRMRKEPLANANEVYIQISKKLSSILGSDRSVPFWEVPVGVLVSPNY